MTLSAASNAALQHLKYSPRKTTMKAARILGPRQIEFVQADMPHPGPTQVRIRVEGCGVCASTLPVWQGREWFQYPFAAGDTGHEGWGTIDEVGSRVKTLKEGDRVAMISYRAFAEYDVAEAAAVVGIPDSFSAYPFPGEPLGCAMNIFHRSGIRTGETVAIIGIGFLGAMLTELAQHAGARVIAASRRPYSCHLAASKGAAHVFDLEDESLAEEIMDLTGGQGCDCVIEVTGKQAPLNLAGNIVRTRGRIVIAGYHQDGLRQVDLQLWNWKGIDVINAHERDPQVYHDGIVHAIHAIEKGRLHPFDLITHELDFDDLPRVFELMESRPDGFCKGVVLL